MRLTVLLASLVATRGVFPYISDRMYSIMYEQMQRSERASAVAQEESNFNSKTGSFEADLKQSYPTDLECLEAGLQKRQDSPSSVTALFDMETGLSATSLARTKQKKVVATRKALLHYRERQLFREIDEMTPNISSGFETVRALGEVQLSRALLPFGLKTASYTIENNPGLILRYMLDCPGVGENDVITQTFFQEKAAEEGVAYRVIHLSRATKMRNTDFEKRFGWHHSYCPSGYGAVRFQVIQRVGRSLAQDKAERIDGTLSMPLAVYMGLETLKLVKRLHAIAIVHGNLIPENISRPWSERDDAQDFMLSDFSRSSLVEQEEERSYATLYTRSSTYMSPWESMGYLPARRDDIFRIGLITSSLMQAGKWMPTAEISKQAWKLYDDIFVSETSNPFERLSVTDRVRKNRSHSCLLAYLRDARALTDPAASIPYESLELSLKAARDWVISSSYPSQTC